MVIVRGHFHCRPLDTRDMPPKILRSGMPRTRVNEIVSTNHATFLHEKKLVKPVPKASFTRLLCVFYPLGREKTPI
jgi:hypothetical protein